MKTITVPREFFVSERNTVYGSWGSAFWRELFSNSIDAGANQIMVRAKFVDDKLMVDFLDNGSGMSLDVVENVYMKLGESTKKGEGEIGGFGRARILTCFSHDAYRIRTKDIVVTGEGSGYRIESSPKSVKGCAVTVTMDPSDSRRLFNGLRDVLRQSHMKCAVLLDLPEFKPDGQSLPEFDEQHVKATDHGKRFTGWSHKGRAFRTLSDEAGEWGTAYISNGATAVRHSSIVRVNGMAMYEDHLGVNSQVTIDLVPERAREVLTASRDSIRNPFRSILQQLYSEIAADTRSAFRARGRQPETAVTRSSTGNSGFSFHSNQEAEQEWPDPSASQARSADLRVDDYADESATDRRKVGSAPADGGDINSSHDEPAMRLPFVLHIGNPTSEQRAAANRFRQGAISSNGGIGRTSELLHAAWTAACRFTIDKLLEIHPSAVEQSDTWSAGFVFDADMGACLMKADGVEHALLLNPVDEGGRLRFKISDNASMKKLISLAIHEVSHINSGWHDERFASTMTDLMGAIRDQDIEREIRNEMSAARDWIAEREAIAEREVSFDDTSPGF